MIAPLFGVSALNQDPPVSPLDLLRPPHDLVSVERGRAVGIMDSKMLVQVAVDMGVEQQQHRSIDCSKLDIGCNNQPSVLRLQLQSPPEELATFQHLM